MLGIFYQNGTIKPYLQDLMLGCGGGSIFPSTPTVTTTNNNTIAPSLAPITVNTTKPTTDVPTSAPSLAVADTPTTVPTSTVVPTEQPTEIASDMPTSSPSLSPSLKILAESTVPSDVQSDVPSSIEPDSSQCIVNPICTASNLTGECCPTPGGVTLLCCGSGVVEEFCEDNNRCVDFELNDGMCCPTSHEDVPEIHNKYLDCCGVLPDECQIDINSTEAENSKCEFMSTVDYKLLYEQYKRDVARSGAVATTAATTLVTIVLSIFVSYSITIQL